VSTAQQFTGRVLQRWVVVVVLALIGAGAAAAWSLTTAVTVWTGTTALTTQSQNRSPEQDAVLALGYVDYFNQGSYQELLRTKITLPAGVQLSARTAATSPIFYIDASGPVREEVRAAAAAATERYRSDVRFSLLAERREAAGDLQAEIDKNVQLVQAPERTDAERNVILDQIRSLQGRLTELEADNTNLVKELQPEPSMTSATPSPVTDVVAGALAGAVLGVLLALLLALLDRRLRTARDLSQRLGLPTLADLSEAGRDQVGRDRRLANLANTLDAGGRSPRTVAVVAARSGRRSSRIARELAEMFAHQSEAIRHVDGYRVLLSTGPSATGGQDPVRPVRFDEIIPPTADAVMVVDAPPLLEAAESQTVCATADQVLVVIERGRSRVTDVREALALLAAVNARVAGAVIDSPASGRQDSPARQRETGNAGGPAGKDASRTPGTPAGPNGTGASDAPPQPTAAAGSRPEPASATDRSSPNGRS
jgi:capsular polysaccharide biosynthesis protein